MTNVQELQTEYDVAIKYLNFLTKPTNDKFVIKWIKEFVKLADNHLIHHHSNNLVCAFVSKFWVFDYSNIEENPDKKILLNIIADLFVGLSNKDIPTLKILDNIEKWENLKTLKTEN